MAAKQPSPSQEDLNKVVVELHHKQQASRADATAGVGRCEEIADAAWSLCCRRPSHPYAPTTSISLISPTGLPRNQSATVQDSLWPNPPRTSARQHPQISETLTKLFLYLDERQWDLLRREVFSQGLVVMDNGDGPKLTSGSEIVESWRANLEGVDAIYHQMNHYMVAFTVRRARVCVERGACVLVLVLGGLCLGFPSLVRRPTVRVQESRRLTVCTKEGVADRH